MKYTNDIEDWKCGQEVGKKSELVQCKTTERKIYLVHKHFKNTER